MVGGLAGMPAAARWVEFEACGREETSNVANYVFAEPPNLGRVFIWPSPGIIVTEIRVQAGSKACTGIAIGGFRYLVVGDYGAVICKLKPGGPYCQEPR